MIILLFADGIVTIFSLREHQEQVEETKSYKYEREKETHKYFISLALSIDISNQDSLHCYDHSFNHYGWSSLIDPTDRSIVISFLVVSF